MCIGHHSTLLRHPEHLDAGDRDNDVEWKDKSLSEPAGIEAGYLERSDIPGYEARLNPRDRFAPIEIDEHKTVV